MIGRFFRANHRQMWKKYLIMIDQFIASDFWFMTSGLLWKKNGPYSLRLTSIVNRS